jgi:hypothetical protein
MGFESGIQLLRDSGKPGKNQQEEVSAFLQISAGRQLRVIGR